MQPQDTTPLPVLLRFFASSLASLSGSKSSLLVSFGTSGLLPGAE